MANRKYVYLGVAMALVVCVVFFSFLNAAESLVVACNNQGSVVEKKAGEAFNVKITFKNTDASQNVWFVNVAFEGDSWFWGGMQQNLTLNAGETKSLVWNGSVPTDAPANSVARRL